jgi:hypothetical protein
MPPLRLVKLTNADLTLSFAPPGLTQTAADTLGNDMTGADGFDQILQGIAAAVSDELPWVPDWGISPASLDFPAGQIVGSLIGPLISDFALFAASGDAQSADLDSLFGVVGNTVPPPPTVTAPKTPVKTAPVHGPSGPGGGGDTTPVYVDLSTGEVYLSPDAGGLGGDVGGFVGKYIK